MLRVSHAKFTTLTSTATDAIVAASDSVTTAANAIAARGRTQFLDIQLADDNVTVDCSTYDSDLTCLEVFVTHTTGTTMNVYFTNVPNTLRLEVHGKYWVTGGTFTIYVNGYSIVTGTNNLTFIAWDAARSQYRYFQISTGTESV